MNSNFDLWFADMLYVAVIPTAWTTGYWPLHSVNKRAMEKYGFFSDQSLLELSFHLHGIKRALCNK